jgi:hypothetical protein
MNRTWHREALGPWRAGSVAPPSSLQEEADLALCRGVEWSRGEDGGAIRHLVVARSVVARLDPALLGRLDLLLAAGAVGSRLVDGEPVRASAGRGRWRMGS